MLTWKTKNHLLFLSNRFLTHLEAWPLCPSSGSPARRASSLGAAGPREKHSMAAAPSHLSGDSWMWKPGLFLPSISQSTQAGKTRNMIGNYTQHAFCGRRCPRCLRWHNSLIAFLKMLSWFSFETLTRGQSVSLLKELWSLHPLALLACPSCGDQVQELCTVPPSPFPPPNWPLCFSVWPCRQLWERKLENSFHFLSLDLQLASPYLPPGNMVKINRAPIANRRGRRLRPVLKDE